MDLSDLSPESVSEPLLVWLPVMVGPLQLAPLHVKPQRPLTPPPPAAAAATPQGLSQEQQRTPGGSMAPAWTPQSAALRHMASQQVCACHRDVCAHLSRSSVSTDMFPLL